MNSKILIHFDMETQDPDDVMTLAILATHPAVQFAGVSLTPGGSDQVGLVRHVLTRLGKPEIPIGGDPSRTKPCVSVFHDKWLGKYKDEPTHLSIDLLNNNATFGATLLTGGPLNNFGSNPHFYKWVAQGGFAGDSVVPPEHRLSKFMGNEVFPTFNFNGSPKNALNMLSNSYIKEKILVSKNVCHSVVWDHNFHKKVQDLPKKTSGMDLVFEGMSLYLKKKPNGKLLHDLLALTVAIDTSVCEFRNVEVYREKGGWGARLKPESDTQITISVNHEKFFNVLTMA